MVSNRQFGLSILLIVASITSPKLCVGIFVAYPALIPVAPFTNKFGNFAGKTTGSFSVSSKFQTISTVFLSISFNNSPLILASLASV